VGQQPLGPVKCPVAPEALQLSHNDVALLFSIAMLLLLLLKSGELWSGSLEVSAANVASTGDGTGVLLVGVLVPHQTALQLVAKVWYKMAEVTDHHWRLVLREEVAIGGWR
jgi:hypothetical protein